MRTLRVNETKGTSRNACIDNTFPLESEKESKNDKKVVFGNYPQIFDVAVNPKTVNATYMWFSGLF